MVEALSFWHRQPRLATGANGETLYSQVTTAQYDALNRVTYSEDPEQFRIWYRYDEVGNRRQVYGQYRNLEDPNLWEAQSFWYAFDAMNRFTVTQGSLAWTGTEYLIVRGGTGTEIAYNGLGQRVETINSLYSEQYSYDDFGYLTETIISSGWTATRSNDRQGRTLDYQEENAAGKVKNHSTYTHDGDNRVLTEKSYDDGSTAEAHRTQTTTNTYDAAGNQVESEVDYRFNSINTITTTTEYQYWGAGNYKQTEVTIAGATAYWPDYRWQPGTAVYHYDVNGHLRQVEDEQGGRVVDFVNNAQGQILRREESKYDSSFTISSYGTLQYTEKANLFYLNGIVIGEVNTTGPSRQDYGSQIASSQQAGRDAKNLTKLNSSGNYGYSTLPDFMRPVMFADLDQNYQPIGRDYPSKVPGAYTVQGGETLADVARSVWGDSSLWYLIAEANGLKGSETLLQGTVLKLPNVVTNVHNNADTFRPYEPGRVIGDVAPTLPDAPSQAPEKPDDSGNLILQIVVVIIVIIVTIYTAGAASSAAASVGSTATTGGAVTTTGAGLTVGGSAATAGSLSFTQTMAAGMSFFSGGTAVGGVAVGSLGFGTTFGIAAVATTVGSLAGQLASKGLGLSDSISFKSALSQGLAGGLTAGLGTIAGLYDVASNAIVEVALQSVSNNVISQGINVALGQQDTFSWRSVASSAIGGAITGAAFGSASHSGGFLGNMSSPVGQQLVSSIISHGVDSAIYGTPFDYAGLATEVVVAGVKSGIASMAQSSQSKPQTVTTNSKEQSELTGTKAGVDAGKVGTPVAQHMQQRETSTVAEQGMQQGTAVASSEAKEPEVHIDLDKLVADFAANSPIGQEVQALVAEMDEVNALLAATERFDVEPVGGASSDLNPETSWVDTAKGWLSSAAQWGETTNARIDELATDPSTPEGMRFTLAFMKPVMGLGTSGVSGVAGLANLAVSSDAREQLFTGLGMLYDDPSILADGINDWLDKPLYQQAQDGFVLGGDLLVGAGAFAKLKKISDVVPSAQSIRLTSPTTSGVLLEAAEGKTTTILGSWSLDMEKVVNELGNIKSMDFGPRTGSFNVLNVDALLKGKEFFNAYNKPWLNNAIERGDNFLMATRPGFDVFDRAGESVLMRTNPITKKMELTGFGREYLMLKKAGYSYQDGRMLK